MVVMVAVATSDSLSQALPGDRGGRDVAHDGRTLRLSALSTSESRLRSRRELGRCGQRRNLPGLVIEPPHQVDEAQYPVLRLVRSRAATAR